jgi:hypothetical protein
MKMELRYCTSNLPICMFPLLALLLLCKVWTNLLLDNFLRWNLLFRVLYPTSRPCRKYHICSLSWDHWTMKPSKLFSHVIWQGYFVWISSSSTPIRSFWTDARYGLEVWRSFLVQSEDDQHKKIVLV